MLVTKTTTAAPSVSTNAPDIRDIKPPIEIVSAWAWLWWTLAALALVAALFALWRWWRKRQAEVHVVPTVPAHVRAKQKLQEALALISQPKPFCTAVSDTTRYYLEERFQFRAPERTTEEFLYELQRTDLLTRDQKESLGAFLQSCDLVKFAKYEPREPELHDLHSSALRLVEETEPSPIPTAPFVEGAHVSTQPTSAEGESPVANENPTPPESTPAAPEARNSVQTTGQRGKALAIVGIILQVGPSVWIIAYVTMLFRLLGLAKDVPNSVSNKGFGAVTEMYSKIVAIYSDTLLLVCVGLLAGLVGIVLLTISLVSSRYRSEWFFWFLVIYGFLLLAPFPLIGTAVGLFFIVYCLTNRKEFFKP